MIVVRAATERDLDTLARIEAESLSGTWTRDSLADELTKSFARLRVATIDENVCAFVHCWLVADELHVLNVATDSGFRRRGIARSLLASVFEDVKGQGFRCALLEVRATNVPAIALYRSLGFNDDTIRPRYYGDGEDALLKSARW